MNQTDPTALWQHLVQWQPATAAALAQHVRALPDDWPLRVFGVGRPDAALLLPPGATGEQFPDRAPEIAPYDEVAPLDDCPACTEVEGTCRWHEGYAAGHHEAVQAQLDAVRANPGMGLREFMRWQADVEEAEDRGEEPPVLPAAALSPPTDRADLRDRIAEVLRTTPSAIGAENPQLGFPSHHQPGESGYLGWCALCVRDVDALADAVLAVLGEQADRAAVARVRALHQQYTFGDGTTDYCAHCNQIRGGWVPWPCPTVRALDVELAVEAQSCRWEHPHPGYQCEPRTTVEAHDTGTQQPAAVALSTPCADCNHGHNWHDKGSGECLMPAPLMNTCDCRAFTAPVAQQPAAEAWDVPDARPGTTDYARQQQAAAADGEEVVAPHCDGFPTTCPNPVPVPPAPPYHDGGFRCGCYDGTP